jgi:hypothetical protein
LERDSQEFSQDRAVSAFSKLGGPLKPKFLFVVSLACLLLVAPGYAKRRRTTPAPATTEDQAATQPAAPPPTLAQLPATPPQVSFQGGQLTISAQNSTLGDILKAVRAQTGATIELPGTASERVVGHFGPAPPRDVLASLLNGSHFNYLLLGSPTDPAALDRVILMAKSGSSADSAPAAPVEQAAASNQTVFARPMTPMAAPPNGNTVVVEGEDAQDDATDDSTDSTDDAQADDQTDQTDQTDDQAATGDDQQQQDGQQNVKTPEQLLQELQQRQQQLQQQGIQPGAPPGMRPFPNPGGATPVQPGSGDPVQPHN